MAQLYESYKCTWQATTYGTRWNVTRVTSSVDHVSSHNKQRPYWESRNICALNWTRAISQMDVVGEEAHVSLFVFPLSFFLFCPFKRLPPEKLLVAVYKGTNVFSTWCGNVILCSLSLAYTPSRSMEMSYLACGRSYVKCYFGRSQEKGDI